jgi:CheY-like chemotaxis protein
MRRPVILLASNPKWNGVAWSDGDGRVQRCTMKEILSASTSQSFAAMPVERIVIEGPLDRREFLVLLSTMHPSFTGDILFIHHPEAAFLSAKAGGGGRVMYTLSKPDIDFYVDVNGLRRDGEETSWQLVSESPGDSARGRAMQVLIAEGDRKTVKSVTTVLTNLGCQALIAESDSDALRLVEQLRPDVLLLDEMAPSIHGYEMARFVRKAYSEYRPRTIIVSTGEEKPEYGIDGYLVRPVAFDQIATAIFGGASP